MRAARIVQRVLLGLGTLLWIGFMVVFGSRAVESGPEVPEPPDSAWVETLEALPDYTHAQEFAAWQEYDPGKLTPEIYEAFSRNNTFLIQAGLLMGVGMLCFGLMVTALASRPSGRFAVLTIGGVLAVVGCAFWLSGFNTTYPGDFVANGFLPASLGGPLIVGEQSDLQFPLYSPSYTVWTDFFYQATYVMTAALMVLGLAAGRYRTPALVLVAVAVGAIGYPIATSWLWGGGWLMDAGAHDFAGSAMVHLLAGGAALALVMMARLFPPLSPWQITPGAIATELRPDRQPRLKCWQATLFGIGGVGFLVLIVGANGGSVLSADVPVVAAVLNATTASMAGGALAALAVSIGLARRPRGVIAAIGALAGWAAICAPADMVSIQQALALGAVAGFLAGVTTWLLDLGRFDDPLGVVPISLVGGAVGTISGSVFSEDTGTAAQLMLLFASSAAGFGLAASLGLPLGLFGLLWEKPPEGAGAQPTPPDLSLRNQA